MANVVNDRDIALLSVAPRLITTTVAISASPSSTFVKGKNGGLIAPTDITLTANTTVFTSATFVWYYSTDVEPNNWIELVGALSTFVVADDAAYIAALEPGETVNFKVEVSQIGFMTATSNAMAISYNKEPDDDVEVYLTKVAAFVLADGEGVVTGTPANTGTTVLARRGTTALTYGASGADTYSVGTPEVDPPGAVTLGTNTAGVFANITAMATAHEYATVSFPVTYRDILGNNPLVRNVEQTFTKIRDSSTSQTYIFTRSLTQPTTPTGNDPTNAGASLVWFDAPPDANGNPLWTSLGKKNSAGVLVGVWSDPIQVEGGTLIAEYSTDGTGTGGGAWTSTFVGGTHFWAQYSYDNGLTWIGPIKIAGEDGIVHGLTKYSVTLPVLTNGDVASWSTATTTYKVEQGSSDISNQWTYSHVSENVVVSRTDNAVTVTGFEDNNVLGDSDYPSVVLLLHFDGSNNSTVITDSSGTPKTGISTSGNAKLSTDQNKWGGSSLVLDGSGDYITVPDSADFNLGSGDFTIEGWFRIAAIPLADHYAAIIGQRYSGLSDFGYTLYLNGDSSGNIRFDYSTSGTSTTGSATAGAPSINSWQHFAVVRNGTSLKVYLNGIGGADHNIGSSAIYNSTTSLALGILSLNIANNYFSGYLDDIRFTKGVARYTSNFDTSLPTVIFPNTATTIYGTPFIDGWVDITAARDGYTSVTKRFLINKAFSTEVVTSNIYPPTVTLQASYLGVVSSYAGTSATVSVALNGVDDSTNWTYVTAPSTGIFISGTNTRSIAIIGITDAINSGYVTVTASKGGYEDQTVRLVVTKSLAGADSFNHSLSVDSVILPVHPDGTISSWASAITTYSVTSGATDVTSDWTYSHTSSTLTISRLLNVVTVTGFADNITVPGDDDYTSVVLLLQCDGTHLSTTVSDSSSSPKTVSVFGETHISNLQSQWGGESLRFDGTGDYIDIPDSDDFYFGTGPFTVEFWIRFASVTGTQRIFGQADASSTNLGIQIQKNSSDKFVFNGTGVPVLTGITTVVVDTWYHVAITGNGTNLKLFVNGTQEATDTYTTTSNSTYKWAIGRLGEYAANYVNGWVDDFRVTKGVSRYNTSIFPVPTAAFSDAVPTYGPAYTSGYADITAAQTGFDSVTKRFSVNKGVSTAVVSAFMNPSSSFVAATADGYVTDVTGAGTTVNVYVDGVDDSTNWTYVTTPSTGLTISGDDTRTIAVTGLTQAQTSGYVDIVASKSNYTSENLKFAVLKNLSGTPSGVRSGATYASINVVGEYVGLKFLRNGDTQVKRSSGGSWLTIGPWYGVVVTNIGDSYWIKVKNLGVAFTSGAAVDTYLQLNTDREWILEKAVTGEYIADLKVYIATDGSGANALLGYGTLELEVP